MAGIFKKAYDQADRILNGSGLSSIVYRQDGGDLSGWDMGDWAEAQMAADTGSRGGDVLTTEHFSHVSSDDIQSSPDPNYGKKELQYLKHLGPTRPKGPPSSRMYGPPSSRMYKDWRSPNFLYDRYEKNAVERNKLYDSTYGGMKPKTPFTNTGYKGRLGYGGVPTHVGSDWVAISDEDAKYMTGVQEFAGQKFVTRDTWEFMQGPEKIKADEIERQKGYAKAEKSLEEDEKEHREIAQEIKDKNLMEEFLKNPNLYLMNRSATGGKVMPGGLSGINKTININGQPHSLAWINPDEASALKAMGGSGKKVGGIPAYYYGYGDYTDEVSDFSSYMDEGGADIMSGTTATEKSTGLDATRHTDPDDRQAVERTYYDPMTQEHVTDRIISEEGIYLPVNVRSRDTPVKGGISETLDPGQLEHWSYADAYNMYPGRSSDYTWQDPYPDKDKGPAGGVPYYGGSDPLTTEDIEEGRFSRKLIPYYNALKERGMSNEEVAAYLSGMGPDSLASMREASDTGYSFGGPMGTMQGLTRDMATSYAKKLKLKELEDEIENLDDKLSSEERTAQIRDIFSRYDIPELGTLTAIKDLKGMGSDIEATAIKHGISPTIAKALSWAAPGVSWSALIAGAGNALAALAGVRGEFETKGGKRFRVMRGGELVEPDLPSVPDEGNVPVTRRPRPRPVQQVSVSEEVEKPLTGIAGLQARRPEVASIGPSLQAQFDNIASIFGREKAAEMLNQPVNIFA